MADSDIVKTLDTRWQLISKLLFGKEIGGIEQYSEWLIENIESIGHRTSHSSGKEVISAPTDYCKDSKWISFDEIDFNKKFEPLGIDEVKDIDSIANAISERISYTGNIFFGKCVGIEKSSNINDSFYLYNCGRFGNSKHLAYCTIGRQNEDCFGCNAISESVACIRCSRSHKNKRCLEVWMSQNSSDAYYSYGLNGCTNCMFCFNARAKRNAIGNLELAPFVYNALKKELVSQMADELEKNKKLPSLLDIVARSKIGKVCEHYETQKEQENNEDRIIEEAFGQTTNILFGKKLRKIDEYSNWLGRHTRKVERVSSVLSGKAIFIPDYANYRKIPKDRLACTSEVVCSSAVSDEDLSWITFKNVHEKIGKIAIFDIELMEGANSGLNDCAISVDSSNCYRSSVTEYSKFCGYCFWPRNCQHVFGCDSPFDSSFSINCYSCTQLTRCFEIDCCGYCSDLYFGHNCENVHQSMFCFNVKNRRNCIGNAQYSQVEYLRIRNSLVSQIATELEWKKELKLDIYNLGCRRI